MSVDNIKIGTCKALFDGVDLGYTKGGVTLTHTPNYSKLTADQWGDSALDYALNGEEWVATLRLTEWQLATLAKVFPMGELVGANDGRLTMGRNAGFRLRDVAKTLVLHPRANDDTDATDDVVFYLAVPYEEVEVEFTNEDQRVFEVKFVALVDTTKADGSWLGHIGDSTD